ncbi:MAG: biopolymer transporter ExbD [Planctomycetota bacterium]|nr:biopolymer transporter ExbD [Planctomycetota bacterium]
MAKGKKQRAELDPRNVKLDFLNMTPMIDVTFQILIFFMLVCHFSSMELEEIALPVASAAEKPEEGKWTDIPVLLVNIRERDPAEGKVTIAGRQYDKDELGKLVAVEARRAGIDKSSEEYVRKGVSRLHVIVRCDKDAPYEAVQWVFEVCSMSKVIHVYISATPQEELLEGA